MRQPATFLVIVLTAVLPGCAGIDVKQDYNPSADFQALKSYAWQQAGEPPEGKTVAESSLVENRIRQAIDRALGERGYRKTTPARADFLVGYYYKVHEKHESSRGRVRTGVGFGTGSRGSFSSLGIGIGLGGRDREYEKGVLTVDVLEPGTSKLMWRGMAEERLVWSNDPHKTTERINKTVKAVVSKFPPKR